MHKSNFLSAKKYIVIILLLAFLNENSFAQMEEQKENDSVQYSFQDKRALILSIETIGPAGFMTFNFDGRFTKRHNGLGFKMGLGLTPDFGYSGSILPGFNFQINYLFGKRNNILDLGLGVTSIDNLILPTYTIAYRRYYTSTPLVLNFGLSIVYKFSLPTIGVGFRL